MIHGNAVQPKGEKKDMVDVFKHTLLSKKKKIVSIMEYQLSFVIMQFTTLLASLLVSLYKSLERLKEIPSFTLY